MTSPAPITRDFFERVLRALAIVCLCFGVFQIINLVVFASVQGLDYGWPGRGRWMHLANQTLRLVMIADAILLAVCGFGLLRWKSWGRTGLIIWAIAEVSVYISSNVVWLMSYSASISASTQPSLGRTPFGFYIWFNFGNVFQHSLFPASSFFVLIQPEVSKLWAGNSRGFEVLPVAEMTAFPPDDFST